MNATSARTGKRLKDIPHGLQSINTYTHQKEIKKEKIDSKTLK